MNIKTGTEILKPVEVPTANRTRTIGSNDREQNLGGHPGAEKEQEEPLTDEEFKEALEHLKSLPAIKDNSFVVKVEMKQNVRVILITDFTGKVLRKIPEEDLRQLLKNKGQSKGQLLDKAM
jgi:uncharacterized FlaG/YvyC family protein